MSNKNNKIKLGFNSAEQAAKFGALAKRGISPDELLTQQKHPEQPEESVHNPDRPPPQRFLERRENAPSEESMMRERFIQTESIRDDSVYNVHNFTI